MQPSSRHSPCVALKLAAAALVAGLCSVATPAPAGVTAAPPPPATQVSCTARASRCTEITIDGDPAAATPTFTGYADPSIVADPASPNRFWLAYSHLGGRIATNGRGRPVGVPHVATHLARSEDGGRHWQFERTLWDSALVADPEGKGPPSYFGSETPSLTVAHSGARTTWYSVRLSYFQAPKSTYEPRFATGWTMRVARADGPSPAALATAPDTVLGVRTTAAAYRPNVDLNSVAPALADCAMWNNPIVTWQDDRLYLVAECLVFRGTRVLAERSRIVVLETEAVGAPAAWQWRYAGVLADHALAQTLGGDQLVSAEIQRARDGQWLFIVSPQRGKGVFGQGCVAMELDGLAPQRLRRNASGAPIVRARQTSAPSSSWRTGGCTYAAGASTGVITVTSDAARGLKTALNATGLTP